MVTRACISINNRCNLNCTYCHFHEKKDYIQEDNMDVITILDIITSHIEDNDIDLFKLGFVGNGEPMLDYEKLKQYIAHIGDYLKSGRIAAYTITNGLLVDCEKLEFFKEYNVNVGFSVDGISAIHDKYRCGTHERVMANIALYKEVNGKYPSMNCTVGKEIIDNPEATIGFFEQFGNRITFSRMIGKQGISLLDFNAFLNKAMERLNVRTGGYDCTMYGGMCGAGMDNIFYANGKIFICGNCNHLVVVTEDGNAVAWGGNENNQAKVPAKATNIAKLASGYYQNCIIKEDGSVVTWGLKGYLLGTDNLGRNVFYRILKGGQMTMTVGFIAVIIQFAIGILVGGISGYYGGTVDILLMRLAEVVGSLPFIPLALILSALIGNKVSDVGRIIMIMLILGFLGWTGIAGLVRAQVLAERNKEFVAAAKALGVKEKNIIFRHIVPNVMTIIIVQATISFATCMLTESGLSFLGFGVAEPIPSWGNMLNNCRSSEVISQYWWRWVFPSVVLGLCTVSINLFGDGLRRAVDPKANER